MSQTQPEASSSRSASYTFAYEEPMELEAAKPKLNDSEPTSTNYILQSPQSDNEEPTLPMPTNRQRSRTFVPPFLQHKRAQRIWRYFRGPRPKVDLPEPVPFLTLSLYSGRRARSLALEPGLVRATRRFTAHWVLVIFGVAYIVALVLLTRSQFYLTPEDSFVTCTSTYWLANDGCGLDGTDCIPSDGINTFDFRCPAQCRDVILLNNRTVGDTQVFRVPLIVGGGDANKTYRGDSFICAAAVHAGMFADSRGGCASLKLNGNFTNFLASTAHGLTSTSFASIFPLSFQFFPNTSLTHCEDLRDVALGVNVIAAAVLFLLLRPRPIILFWSLVCIGFWHVTLFSQPRDDPPPIDLAFGTFLPTLFVAYGIWRCSFRFVLPTFAKAPIERAVWYIAPFWVGILLNVVGRNIPIDRLVVSDIQNTPGALTAVIIIALVVLIIVLNQIRVIRKTGWLPHFVVWYVLAGLVVLALALLPGLQLRFHHYIAALLFLPGTAFPTRLSAIYQSFLLGMFLNGVAAFGYDSIVQTSAALRRDATAGTEIPTFLTNSTTYNSSIPFAAQRIFWEAIPDSEEDWEGFTLLVDDVVRLVGPALNFSLASLEAGIPHFFRLAFAKNSLSGDFTMPATLWPNGTWVDPPPGAT